ncbi:MAG: molybdate ABC transporter permease subunit, partial [Brooklawnia sp.]
MVKTPGVPGWLLIPAGLAVAFVGTPLIGLVPSVDWPNFWGLITSKSSLTALRLSLQTAAASTLVCLLVGVPLAL